MNVAFKAAARSACLSRQVGAAIVDKDGQLLATGCNDVPRFGGGLYSSEDAEDKRCWTRGGKCYNDDEKSLIVEELVGAFSSGLDEEALTVAGDLGFSQLELKGKLQKVLKSVLDSSRIRQLIEFSRAVHAEMDAIVAVARSGKTGIVGGTIYCTTYPCHNCTKHIIDVGISRLVYLEPYEKSLAKKLHSDAISDSGDISTEGKVAFQLYNGVSPGRYAEFFEMRQSRKKDGRYIDRSDNKADLLPLVRESTDELWRRIHKELPQAQEGQ